MAKSVNAQAVILLYHLFLPTKLCPTLPIQKKQENFYVVCSALYADKFSMNLLAQKLPFER
jgi:hypothetical protein